MCKVTVEAYGEAVLRLLKIAKTGTSGARAAAQVLLSAYNGEEWQLDIVDLSLLDRDYYTAALLVIRGRTELSVEPHTLIEDGSRHFGELWDRWERLHVKKQGKIACRSCDGRGFTYQTEEDCDLGNRTTCRACGGKGRYWDN